MEVVLPQKLEDCMAELVQTIGYKDCNEVIVEALREHQLHRRGMAVVMTPELERMLDEGMENLEAAKTTGELHRHP